MPQEKVEFFYRVSATKYGLVGIFVSPIILSVGIWIILYLNFPLLIRYLCGPIVCLIGLVFIYYAATDLFSKEYFESSIRNGIYTQVIPRKSHHDSFSIDISDINFIVVERPQVARDGSTTWNLKLNNGSEKRITSSYWNPVSNILIELTEVRPDLPFCDRITQEVAAVTRKKEGSRVVLKIKTKWTTKYLSSSS